MSGIITHDRLVNDFRSAGVNKGDSIMLHSSLKSIGWVENGADTVIDALLEVLGDEGTLAVPTYTYSYIYREGAEAYDIKNTPSQGNGIITEVLRKREGAERSGQPTHSVAAKGKAAGFITSGHPEGAPFGIGSPLHKLAQAGGKILLLGVGHNRNSLIHVGEITGAAKYNRIPFKESWGRSAMKLNSRNEKEIVPQHEFPGCSYNFGAIEDILISKGVERLGQAGNAVTRIMSAQAVLELVADVLRVNPGFLLCDRPDCECCMNRKKLLAQSS